MEAYQIVGIVLIICGLALFVIRGIFRIGEGWGRQRWLYNKVGPDVTRAINIIIAVALIIAGIVLLLLDFT
ncbi:MAG: hypothetical protein ACW96S_07565 [Promethearchaeota archaeon]|jgi:uncharacterized membrane protein YidH (DUF202 family)